MSAKRTVVDMELYRPRVLPAQRKRRCRTSEAEMLTIINPGMEPQWANFEVETALEFAAQGARLEVMDAFWRAYNDGVRDTAALVKVLNAAAGICEADDDGAASGDDDGDDDGSAA